MLGNEDLAGRYIELPGGSAAYLYQESDVITTLNFNGNFEYAALHNGEVVYDSLLETAPNPNTIDNSLFNLEVDVDTSNLIEGTAWEDGIVDFGADWVITMDPLVLNVDGLQNVYASSIVSDAYRPGAASLSTFNLPSLVDNVFNSWQNDLYTPGLTNLEFNFVPATLLNNFYYASPTWLNIDPLVLDMDGDGIELTTFEQANVVFDIDNDGLDERTGWLNGDDAFLVRDNNNDGIINDVSEIFSEYFDGGALDGIAALARYDANNDGVFNDSDAEWDRVRVWLDADADGRTDAGELLTLDAAGIASINLSGAYRTNGEIVAGNEVFRRTSTIMSNNDVRDVASINFTVDPLGHEWIEETGGAIVNSEDIVKSYVVTTPNGMAVSAAAKQVNNLYGNIGHDALTGDAGDNWLAGNAGSDTLIGGAGDDMLIIDAEDESTNIDGGDGFDIVKVVSDDGVALNLFEANVEVVTGGRGNDVLVGGGTSNVFIDGDDGNDILIGGGADDALSGGDGEDLLDGSFGDDLLRGHRGEDMLIGGDGDDFLDGGQDDDVLKGGDGNDILKGGAGTDIMDGGAGTDAALFDGGFAEYHFYKSGNNIVITHLATQVTETLVNIEKMEFDNVVINGTFPNPLAVNDTVAVQGASPYTILASTILANDMDFQNDALHITAVEDAVGGTVALNGSGNVVFTPDANFHGVMSFKYKIADSQNNPGPTVSNESGSSELRGTVTLQLASQPDDPLFADQWYLSEIGAPSVWNEYTGAGVNVGVFELGPYAQLMHTDLDDNAGHTIDIVSAQESHNPHATIVAGIIGAERNGEGSVGVAYDVTLDSYSPTFGENDGPYTPALFHWWSTVDVVNNSWGYAAPFTDNTFEIDNGPGSGLERAYEYVSEFGRDGLGTSIVFGSGNSREEGRNTNDSNITSARQSITVGGINKDPDVSSLETSEAAFSTPGASILVSAPSSQIYSTNLLIENSNGSTFGNMYDMTSGTSFATPIVSGVVALMLEANPNLGWRDIQKILAYSAKSVTDPETDWAYNGANDWNGGGLHTSHDYGFGMVDAHAAVRLAETWNSISNSQNEVSVSATNATSATITDAGTITRTLNIASSINVEHVEVVIDTNHTNIGDLIITLISPDGTESILLDRIGKEPGSGAGDLGLDTDGLHYRLSSTHHWGEMSAGTWTLEITDAVSGGTGSLLS